MANCLTCGHLISDTHLLKIDKYAIHEACARCSICSKQLLKSCYLRNDSLFCRNDYLQKFAAKCFGCGLKLQPQMQLMKAGGINPSCFVHGKAISSPESSPYSNFKINYCICTSSMYFHVECFRCGICERQLNPGDQYVAHRGSLICLKDYEKHILYDSDCRFDENVEKFQFKCDETSQETKLAGSDDCETNTFDNSLADDDDDNEESVEMTESEHMAFMMNNEDSRDILLMDEDDNNSLLGGDSDSDSGKNSKRPRTILTASQRRRFKHAFEMNPKPTRKIRENLARETGLNVRVVQVWFQNQRAKVKKLARRQAQETQNHVKRASIFGGHSSMSNQHLGNYELASLHQKKPSIPINGQLQKNSSNPLSLSQNFPQLKTISSQIVNLQNQIDQINPDVNSFHRSVLGNKQSSFGHQLNNHSKNKYLDVIQSEFSILYNGREPQDIVEQTVNIMNMSEDQRNMFEVSKFLCPTTRHADENSPDTMERSNASTDTLQLTNAKMPNESSSMLAGRNNVSLTSSLLLQTSSSLNNNDPIDKLYSMQESYFTA